MSGPDLIRATQARLFESHATNVAGPWSAQFRPQLAHRAAHGGDQRLSDIKLDAISG